MPCRSHQQSRPTSHCHPTEAPAAQPSRLAFTVAPLECLHPSFEVRMPSRLNPEDQKLVDQYLNAPQHQVERRPFRPWLLLVLVLVVVVGLGLLSRFLSHLVL